MGRVSAVFQETVNRVFLMQFSAALWNGPVAAARKESKKQFSCHRRRRVTWRLPAVNTGVSALKRRTPSPSDHRDGLVFEPLLPWKQTHVFWALATSLCLQLLWRKIWRHKRGTPTDMRLQWYLSLPDSVNWLATCWKWSIDRGDGSLSGLQTSLFLSAVHKGHLTDAACGFWITGCG